MYCPCATISTFEWPVLGRDNRLTGRLLIPVQVKLVLELGLRKALLLPGRQSAEVPASTVRRQPQPLDQRHGLIPRRKMLLHGVTPPARLGSDICHLAAPTGRWHSFPERSVQLDRAFVWIEIGDGSKQQALTGTGRSLQGNTFPVVQIERNRNVQTRESLDSKHDLFRLGVARQRLAFAELND